MRSTTAAGCAVALAALLTTAACGGATHHAHAHAAAKPGHGKGGTAAGKAVAAMVARVDTRNSTRLVMTQRRGNRTTTMSGWQTWGSGGPGLDMQVAPADLGMQNLNHADRMEMRSTTGTEYLAIDPVKSGAFKGKRWLKYSTAAVGGSALTGEMEKEGRQSPVDALRASATAGRVTLVGPETVDGRATTHYRATVAADPGMVALEHVPATARADVWVGRDGYPVRYVWDDGKQRNVSDFQSFGGVRHIAVPPAAQVADASAAARSGT